MSRTSIPSRCIAAVLLLLTAAPVPAHATQAEPGSPQAFLARFADAWQRRDLDAYAALLTDDFRFYFGDAEGQREHPAGWECWTPQNALQRSARRQKWLWA